jgi:hypothetical protein
MEKKGIEAKPRSGLSCAVAGLLGCGIVAMLGLVLAGVGV